MVERLRSALSSPILGERLYRSGCDVLRLVNTKPSSELGKNEWLLGRN